MDDDKLEIFSQLKNKLVERGDFKLIEKSNDIPMEEVDLACNIFFRYYYLFEEGKVHGCTPDADALSQGVLKMLRHSSSELNFDDNSEIERMDKEAYMMLRNLVEWCELRKEKSELFWDHFAYLRKFGDHFYYLEKEYQVLMESWNRFLANAGAVLSWKKNTQKMAHIVQLHDFVGNIISSNIGGNELISAAQEAYNLLNEYKRSIPASIASTTSVAKLANCLVGVPNSWLLNSFQPPLDCLEERLMSKGIGQDYAIKRIANTMSRLPRLGGENPQSPLASFILLSDVKMIRFTKFFESLAEALYDSKDRLIRFNLDMDSNGSSSSNVDPRDRMYAVQQKVVEVVKNKPFSALLFENVNACGFAADFLESILEHGIKDDEGTRYNLSNTLIMITYTVSPEVRNALHCKCLEMGVAQIRPCNKCAKVHSHLEALDKFGRMHLLVDDVVILDTLLPHPQVVTRIHLREVVDASWRSHRQILYTSEAAMEMLANCKKGRGKKGFLKKWLNKVLSSLNPKEDGKQTAAGDMTGVHIDVLVASRKLSVRSLELDSALDIFKESLKRWRTVYLTEKGFAREIVELCTACSDLLSPMQSTNGPDLLMTWFKNVANVLDDIISYRDNCNSLVSEQDLVPPNAIQADIANWRTDLNKMKAIRMTKVPMILEEKYHMTDYIIESKSSNGFGKTLGPKLFLCLGLNDTGKADLVAALNKSFISSSGGKSIIEMNMEEYSESDSMRFIDHFFALVRHSSFGKNSTGSKRKRTLSIPGGVLLIDRLGEAHASVFGAFVSMLDRGSLESGEGESLDFCNVIVIVMSDLGSKEILARVAQNANGIDAMEAYSEKRREKPFRSELLNRLDAVLMFDPFLEKQMQKFFRLQVGQVEMARQLPYLVSILFSEIEHKPPVIRKDKVRSALQILEVRAA